MKPINTILIALAVMLSIAPSQARVLRYGQRSNLLIENFDTNEVKLAIHTVTSGTNLIEIVDDTTSTPTNLFVVPATGILGRSYGGSGTNTVAGAKHNLGIQSGTSVSTNLFLTTNTFSPVFSATPNITVGGPTNALPHVVSVNPTNFVIGVATTNVTIQWIAVGAP